MNYKAISLILGLLYVTGCFAQGANLPVVDSCFVCDSRTNVSCAIDPEANHQAACDNAPFGAGCYTRIINGFTSRGCTSDLDADVVANCRNNIDSCSICVGDTNSSTHGCNRHIFPDHRHRCHVCQGPLNGTCDEIPTGLPTFCEFFDPNDRCYILRTSETVTRGCMSTRGTNCENPQHCHICEVSGCNNLNGNEVPIAPGSAVTNTVSMVMLSTAFIFALAKSFLN